MHKPPIIEIGNSICIIHYLSLEHLAGLKKILFYTMNPQAAFFAGSQRNYKTYLITPRGQFPTGLLYLVKAYFKKHNIAFHIKDTRKVPIPHNQFTMQHLCQPYPEQIEAAQVCKKYTRGIISAPTGVGKSLIAALIIEALQVNTLIVTPSLELKRQLLESMQRAFGTTFVGELGSPIAVCNVQALDPNIPVKYDCLIIDEFHHSGAKTYQLLNKKAWNGIYYKIGLTATPWRTQETERLLLESVLSQIIYRITYIDAINANYISPVQAYYVESPIKSTEARIWAKVYADLVVHNKPRNELIVDLLESLYKANKSTLCLVKEIQHGNNLVELLAARGLSIPFVSGVADEDPSIEINRFNRNQTPVLIGTTGIIGEGVDTKPTEYVIIAGLGKAKGQFMQQVGRGVRRYGSKESCKVILIKDKSHKWTLNHFNAQVRVLKEEYNIIPILL